MSRNRPRHSDSDDELDMSISVPEPLCDMDCVRDCDGDWTRDPRFFKSEAVGIERFGFTREVCEAAFTWLKWAYPVEHCRNVLAGHSDQGRLVMPLYFGGAILPGGAGILQTGWLMHMAEPHDDLEVRGDLRQPSKYGSAVQELEVRAQLLQAGLQVKRAGIRGQKRPEYEALSNGERYYIEVKRQGRRDDEIAVEYLQDALLCAISNVVREGYHCYVRGGEVAPTWRSCSACAIGK